MAEAVAKPLEEKQAVGGSPRTSAAQSMQASTSPGQKRKSLGAQGIEEITTSPASKRVAAGTYVHSDTVLIPPTPSVPVATLTPMEEFPRPFILITIQSIRS